MNLNQAFFREGMSTRRFFVLMKGLPAQSSFMQFISDKDRYSLATYDPQNITIQ